MRATCFHRVREKMKRTQEKQYDEDEQDHHGKRDEYSMCERERVLIECVCMMARELARPSALGASVS